MDPSRRPDNRHFAPGREFSLIESLFATTGATGGKGDAARFPPDATGIGDDACLIRAGGETLAATTDASVEGVHYRLDWASPAEALEKCLLSNLSDLNAMGARASHALLTLGVPAAWGEEEFARLGKALQGLEAARGFRVTGGDTVRQPSGSFFSFTLIGPLRGRPLLRGNARPGHGIYVSGTLGGSAAGLRLLETGRKPGSAPGLEALLRRHLRPDPPLGLGPFLASLPGPVSAIDLSDGLSSELWHLSRQSGCRLVVEWGKLPYEKELGEAAALLGAAEAPLRRRDWVLHGGEEYQLLFTGEFGDADLAGMAPFARVTRIGTVRAGTGVALLEEDGAEADLPAGGWSH
jgi:thiamine-monophosphate kinase